MAVVRALTAARKSSAERLPPISLPHPGHNLQGRELKNALVIHESEENRFVFNLPMTVFNLPMTHLTPQNAWSSALGFIDHPVIGFVLLMSAMLLCALLLLGRRPRLAHDPSKNAPTTPVRLR